MNEIFQDFAQLYRDLIIWIGDVNYFVLLGVIGLQYLYQRKENNYATLDKLLSRLVRLRYVYRYLKYSIALDIILIIVSHYKIWKSNSSYDDYKYNNFVFDNIWNNLFQYLFLIFIGTYIIYRLFSDPIRRYLSTGYEFRWQRRRYIFIKFLVFALVSFFMQLLLLFLSKELISFINNILLNSGFYPLIPSESTDLNTAYKQGVYIAIILSISLVFVLLNAIVKNLNHRYNLPDFLMYVFVLIIVGFGTYSGFYAIINYLINANNFGWKSSWTDKDKLIGNFSIRITAIFLLWGILKFIFSNVFKKGLIRHLIDGLLPVDRNNDYSKNLGQLTAGSTDYFDLLYFAQVGYYILNIFSVQFLIANLDIDFYATIVFLLLPVIVDDFFVIHVYHKKYNYINKWHFIKIVGFNILLFAFSAIALLVERHYIFFAIYIFITITLLLLSRIKTEFSIRRYS